MKDFSLFGLTSIVGGTSFIMPSGIIVVPFEELQWQGLGINKIMTMLLAITSRCIMAMKGLCVSYCWPSKQRRSRIVLIFRGISQKEQMREMAPNSTIVATIRRLFEEQQNGMANRIVSPIFDVMRPFLTMSFPGRGYPISHSQFKQIRQFLSMSLQLLLN